MAARSAWSASTRSAPSSPISMRGCEAATSARPGGSTWRWLRALLTTYVADAGAVVDALDGLAALDTLSDALPFERFREAVAAALDGPARRRRPRRPGRRVRRPRRGAARRQRRAPPGVRHRGDRGHRRAPLPAAAAPGRAAARPRARRAERAPGLVAAAARGGRRSRAAPVRPRRRRGRPGAPAQRPAHAGRRDAAGAAVDVPARRGGAGRGPPGAGGRLRAGGCRARDGASAPVV